MKTRVPSDLLWIIGWSLFIGGVSLFVAVADPKPSSRILYGVFAALYLITALGLYRMKPWGRVLGGTVLLLGAVVHGIALLKGFTGARVIRCLMNLYWGVYLFLPATRRMFAVSSGSSFDRVGCLVLAINLLLVVVAAVALLALKAPTWLALVVVGILLVPYVFFEDRIAARLIHWFAPRPDDLDRPGWAAFKSARETWRRGDLDGAERLLQPLAPTLSVRLIRGLLRMDRAKTSEGLDRILYDYSALAGAEARDAILKECQAADLDARIADRAALVDDLLEDDARAYPLFAAELDARIQNITGRIFISNASFQHREDWETTRRKLCTGDRGRIWLTIRLWDAQCPEAAEAVAASSKDPQLAGLAALAARLNFKGVSGLDENWLTANSFNLCLLPGFSDAARLLYLDSPYLDAIGTEAAAARMPARLEYVARLRRLREEYPSESWIEIPWLMALLIADPDQVPRKKKKFEAWWLERRAAQVEFDGAFVSGLEAAKRGDWTRAEEAFGEAKKAWPERSCAAYNHGLSLLHLERFADGEALFEALAKKEPDEAVYWMRLGDARRALGRIPAALEAYRTAARLGGVEEQIAFRLGTTLAAEGRDEEAEKQLDALTGPDPEKIEEVASFLESQGIYRLAARYREKALQQRLGEKPSDKDDSPEDEEDLEPA